MNTRILTALAALAISAPALAGATITVVNINPPGSGFNDPTPAVPVGNNPGTTVGQQRLIAFNFAADVWGRTLDSNTEVRIRSSFEPLACTATSAVLGSAGPVTVFRDFPGAELAGRWYHVALANKLAMQDLAPGDPGAVGADDINARFNSNLGNTGCLTGNGWYYGLDTKHAANQINLVTVLLHEFAHGLGFSSVTSSGSGKFLDATATDVGHSDTYSNFYFDNSTGLSRDQMSIPQRIASAVNPRNVVFAGSHVTANVPAVLAKGTPLLVIAPGSPASGSYQVGAASFGPQLASPGVTGQVAAALDASNSSGPSVNDACTAITNPGSVFGRIAIVNRGSCTFATKVKNAQNAGAIAVIVADNVAGGPPAGLGGADPTIIIPSVRVTLADGTAIRTALAAGTVTATLGVDLTVRAGADRAGRALLYTPNPLQPGSSVSHWDTSAFPNQLMEPSINSDLQLKVDAPYDLTRPLLRDIGWFPDADLDGVADDAGDECLGSDLRPTVIIGAEDTGVPNTFFTNGCTVRDFVRNCQTGAKNHGGYVSCVASLTNQLRDAGIISGEQKGRIQSAAAHDH